MARRQSVPHVTTMHGRLDMPELVPLFRHVRRRAAGVDLGRAARPAARRRTGRAPSITGCPSICIGRSPGTGRLPRVPRAHLAREARRSRDRDRPPAGHAAEDRRQDRRQGSRVLRERDQAAVRRIRWSSSSARSARTRRTSSWAARAALLFPIDWPEPFGLVMIEAMACGTPVVAFRCGSVPEVMRDGVSGFVVDTIDAAVSATARAVELPRAGVPAATSRSASRRRAWRTDYVAVYKRADRERAPPQRPGADGVRAGGDRRRGRRRRRSRGRRGWAAKRA